MAAEPFVKTALRQAALAIPIFIVHQLLSALLGPVLDNRLLLAALTVPLAIGCWVLWRLAERDRGALLDGRFLAFFLVFSLLFGLLTSTPLRSLVTPGAASDTAPGTDWRQRLLPGSPNGWLGRILPAGAIDWRYRLVDGWQQGVEETARAANDLLMVTMPQPGNVGELGQLRKDLAFIIAQARRRGATGVGLDYYLLAETTDWDWKLCEELEAAATAGFPVVVGFTWSRAEELPLDACLAGQQRGHVGAVLDLDGRVRSLPVFLDRGRQKPALSWRMATAMNGGEEPTEPPAGIVRLLPPPAQLATHHGRPVGPALKKLEGAYVLVAADSPADVHSTPWGEQAGPVLHAWAAVSLAGSRYLRRLHPAWSFPTVFAVGYLLTVVLARRGGWRRLTGLAVAVSVAWLAVSALAARLAGLWIDIGPPLAGIWVLTGLLLTGNGVLRGRVARPLRAVPAAGPAAATAGPAFDIFLSHNGDDKPVVRELADALEARGLSPWLDERQLVPGQPWQEALEEIIVTARSSAVLVGPNGLGPWQTAEMRACLQQFVERRRPVIPVLLPGCPARPNLPLFLTQATWVDLRQGLTEAGLDRLQWAITGRKPERRAA